MTKEIKPDDNFDKVFDELGTEVQKDLDEATDKVENVPSTEEHADLTPEEAVKEIRNANGDRVVQDTPYAFTNDGQIYINNRVGRRGFKRVWRSVLEKKTGIGKAVDEQGKVVSIPKLRFFTQHIPTHNEIRARRKAERQNRGK